MPMTAAQRAECDALLDKMLAEQKAEIDARPPPKKSEVDDQAKFLRGWSKYKPIRKSFAGDADTFYSCGKWTTKIDPKVVDALLKSGAATGTKRDFTMVRP